MSHHHGSYVRQAPSVPARAAALAPAHPQVRPCVSAASPQKMQITPAAYADLERHVEKLRVVASDLPEQGRDLLHALHAAMMSAVADNQHAHFESMLEEQMLAHLPGSGMRLERIASGQWRAVGGTGHEFILSVRTEVLGAPLSETFELLSQLKTQARAARSTLLGDGAQWMRKLGKGDYVNRRDFLKACRDAGSEGSVGARTRAAHGEWDGEELCCFCEHPLSTARLGGKHRCHVTGTFRCPGCWSQWSSAQARFDPEEERVLGQKCKECQEFGQVIRYQFCEAPVGREEAGERKPHRIDLCEACDRFGHCQGAFFEPFVMSSAVALHAGMTGTQWAKHDRTLVTDAGRYAVAMLPHVFFCQEGRANFSHMASGAPKGKGGGSGGKGGRFGNAGGRGGKGGKSGGKGKSVGKSGGKGGKRGTGSCRFGDHGRYSHAA